jgi:hypothetical protein
LGWSWCCLGVVIFVMCEYFLVKDDVADSQYNFTLINHA